MVLAISPAIGLFAGAGLVHRYGYAGVMLCLLAMAVALLFWTATALAETKPALGPSAPLVETLCLMLRDRAIWRSALLVAIFNVALFSYYALGPFAFQHLHLSDELYGYSGAVLGVGAFLGSWLTKWLLKQGMKSESLILLASLLALLGGIGAQILSHTIWFLLAVLVVEIALVIPPFFIVVRSRN